MAEIILATGERVLVDDEDFEQLNHYKWSLSEGYAITTWKENGRFKSMRMHRLIMNTPAGMECDHIHHNTLDNRKSELRNTPKSGNQGNRVANRNGKTSQFKGVCFRASRNKWVAQLRNGLKTKWLGHFDEEIDAARAYDKAAKAYFGEFALTNF